MWQLVQSSCSVGCFRTNPKSDKVLEGDPPVDLEIRESTWMASNKMTEFAVTVAEQATETEQASVTEEQVEWPEVVQTAIDVPVVRLALSSGDGHYYA